MPRCRQAEREQREGDHQQVQQQRLDHAGRVLAADGEDVGVLGGEGDEQRAAGQRQQPPRSGSCGWRSPPAVSRVLIRNGLDRLIPIYSSLEAAVAGRGADSGGAGETPGGRPACGAGDRDSLGELTRIH